MLVMDSHVPISTSALLVLTNVTPMPSALTKTELTRALVPMVTRALASTVQMLMNVYQVTAHAMSMHSASIHKVVMNVIVIQATKEMDTHAST